MGYEEDDIKDEEEEEIDPFSKIEESHSPEKQKSSEFREETQPTEET